MLFALSRLKNENKKHEYYLTDIYGILQAAGRKIVAVQAVPQEDVLGVNTRQQLADGTTISHDGRHAVARDAEGRVRVELRMGRTHDGEPETVMVFVTDPVAHTLTTWMTGGKGIQKVASVVKLPTAEIAFG